MTLIVAPARALVDMRNANYSVTFVDLTLPGGFEIDRTYNSRALFNGAFGFGWCSSLEDELTRVDENVFLFKSCGSGQETLFHKVRKVASQSPGSDDEPYELYTGGRGRTLQIFADRWVHFDSGRSKTTGAFRKQRTVFNLEGRPTAIYWDDKPVLRIEYTGFQIVALIDGNNGRWRVAYNVSRRVEAIVGPVGQQARYRHGREDDLVHARNGGGEEYSYSYSESHNMTKLVWPDGTYNELTYDDAKDWVTSFRDRDGCQENYEYRDSKRAPRMHYMSTSLKVCKDKEVGRKIFEFVHSESADGSRVNIRAVREYTLVDRDTNQWKRLELVYDENGGVIARAESTVSVDVDNLLD